MSVMTLVLSLLVTAAITLLAVAYLSGRSGQGAAQLEAPVARAHSVECLARRRRVETQIRLYSVQNGACPERLENVDGLVDQDLYCPVTRRPYEYDPGTGRVRCPDHSR